MIDTIKEKIDRIKPFICPLQIKRMTWLIEQTDMPNIILTHLDALLNLLIKNIENNKILETDPDKCKECEEFKGFKIQIEMDEMNMDIISLSENHCNN